CAREFSYSYPFDFW
nr:immunoglobulin heavy chain junction region [Mus musculus]